MRERPILLNAEMVRAVLDGRKTQTRRIIQSPAKNMQANGQKVIDYREPGDKWYGEHVFSMRNQSGTWCDYTKEQFLAKCPFGAVGERLWVRETWQAIHDSLDEFGNVDERTWIPSVPKSSEGYWRAVYAEEFGVSNREDRDFPWRPAIHMPRWASRITLEITGVRVERLQDISEADACAEGIRAGVRRTDQSEFNEPVYCNYLADNLNVASEWFERPSDSFISLWQSIYGEESWQHSPWVWVIEFKLLDIADKAG
ncbi:hypothetical protein [Pantoea ananatis]|uniref:hypothetical protein n=1 Tax=Pantoea ananas TaxID=553 RepID=UPI0002F7B486|nr:hypothetical protein [Pantoea ananatis]